MKFPNRRRGVAACGVTAAILLAIALLWPAFVGAADEQAEAADEPTAPGTLTFVGHNLFGDADGTFHVWRVVESELDLENLATSFAVVEIDLASVDTGIGRRDDHLRNPDFFEVETYPVATVRVHTARPIEADGAEDGAEDEGKPRYQAQFHIDLHGVQKTVMGEITLESKSPVVFEGELSIDRTDFDVGPPPSGWNPMSPRAEIPVRFRVEL